MSNQKHDILDKSNHHDEMDDDNSDDYDDYEDMDEEVEIQKIKSLFDDQMFDSIKDLYNYEKDKNDFDLIKVIRKYKMDMMSYIKMINFIRSKKPCPGVFKIDYKNLNDVPWGDDEYFKTVIEDDPLLQFDVDEDLDILEQDTNEKENESLAIIKTYDNKLKESESKIEELCDMVSKLRNYASDLLENQSEKLEEKEDSYATAYSNYGIHLQMLQDKIRTESYMNAVLNNKNFFQDKIVLDVGCGTGILSMFAAKAGAKLVIAVDMSSVIDEAIKIAEENGFKDKIVFLKGKVEEVQLPVPKVDIIISEWMGYFLLFESMFDSVIYARDKYLDPSNGIVLPNLADMEIFGVSDMSYYEKYINYWSDVYGFKMSCMRKHVLHDAQVTTIKSDSVITDIDIFKSMDCGKCTVDEISKFESKFKLKVKKDAKLTGIGVSFNIYFSHNKLDFKNFFPTNPYHPSTHWEQTYFQLENPIDVSKDSVIVGEIICSKHPDSPRSYIVKLNLFDKIHTYYVE